MFHIPNSALKYLCAKYTYFLIHKGRKDSGHQKTPGTPNLIKKGKSPHHNLRMWRKERFMKWVK
ncbi:hypothetical protein AB205_0214280 [Aquarana catesbeiana]|uniref:Uncharacterized protein n=1 Tax=Aquarana catesbeiana TaxID=8400 RepID=A0A2G9QG04_AQUCT|nr:hypothetical protein AB205_0214280 [Aquarana catesbeiana]